MLPHFNKIPKFCYEPIYTNLFEIDFISDKIKTHEIEILKELVIEITKSTITFNVDEYDNIVHPFHELEILKENPFDIILSFQNKENTTICKFLLKNINISYSYEQILNLSYNNTDILKDFKVNYTFENIEYLK